MSRLLFDIDDIVGDLQSLQISALTNAARISPFVYGRTIGPKSNDESNDDVIALKRSDSKSENDKNSNNISDRSLEAEKEDLKSVPDLRVTFSNRRDVAGSSPNSRKVDISDCKAVSFKLYQQELERQRMKNVRKELEERQARVREADRLRDSDLRERLKKVESKTAKKIQEDEQKLIEAIRKQELEAKQSEQRKLVEINETNRRLAEISSRLKKNEEEIKRKNAMFDEIQGHHANFRQLTEAFTKSLMNIDREYSSHFSNQKKSVQSLVKSFEQLLQTINAHQEVTQTDIDKGAELCKSMESTNGEVVETINQIQKEIAEKIKNQQEQRKAESQQKVEVQQQPPKAQDTTDTKPKPAASTSQTPHPLASIVSREALAFYTEIKTFYEQHQAAVKVLLDDASMKSYRFNCQKVINTPINAISSVSREHLLDKYQSLDALLAGQPVRTGEQTVSIQGHPLGKTYCTMLMAKKFVSQADIMISSNAPAAFPIAAIIVALWQKYPAFGKFFLAYLHKECPYLVPYFLPQLEGQSQEDYLKSIGYRFSSDGVLEKQDQYLKRMTGMARLYAAVVVANTRQGESAAHPHSVDCGYRWLCNILNLAPLPDICATLLTEFLTTAGPSLWAAYGKQFVKVLQVIQQAYLPALNKVDEGGPKTRLEVLMAKINTEGRIERPEGMLGPDFW
ncbi:mRNA export factor Gle1 [Uranotaenia lowii]|uniref:mRNA export factor Gle1 n=1 Tax=Uranotaenia lowii TaxID=190385 RepID=UPI0024795FB7|nr:mRNA export factor Gle1 [Uranotaenia lowii]